MIPIYKAIEFLRDNGICQNWTDKQLHIAIHNAVCENALAFEVDPSETQIISFCLGRWTTPEEYHVLAIAGKSRIHFLLKHLKDNYPNCKYITGLRKMIRPRRFEVSKLYKKFKV